MLHATVNTAGQRTPPWCSWSCGRGIPGDTGLNTHAFPNTGLTFPAHAECAGLPATLCVCPGTHSRPCRLLLSCRCLWVYPHSSGPTAPCPGLAESRVCHVPPWGLFSLFSCHKEPASDLACGGALSSFKGVGSEKVVAGTPSNPSCCPTCCAQGPVSRD